MRGSLLLVPTLLLLAASAQAMLVDDESTNNDINTATVQITPSGEAVTTGGGLLTLVAGDTDYVGIGNLLSGDVVVVVTTPLNDPPNLESPDTIVGLFDSNGTMTCIYDDTFNNELDNFPTGLGSLCRFVIDSAGDWFVGVTGFSPTAFDGTHLSDGDYQLTVSIYTPLPEPSVVFQLVSGAIGLAGLHRRRNQRMARM